MTPDGNGTGKPLELTITRTIRAPRLLVWKAWTDPEHVTNWGPEGFSVEIAAYDLRPGGAWRACLHPTGGGKDLWQGGTFREIVEGRRLVYTFAWDEDDPGSETVVTLTLEDDGDGTLLTFHQIGFAAGKAETALCRDTLTRRFEHLAGRLHGNWLFGDRFSAADPYLYVMLRWAAMIELAIPPALFGFRERVEGRPAVQAALRAEGLA